MVSSNVTRPSNTLVLTPPTDSSSRVDFQRPVSSSKNLSTSSSSSSQEQPLKSRWAQIQWWRLCTVWATEFEEREREMYYMYMYRCMMYHTWFSPQYNAQPTQYIPLILLSFRFELNDDQMRDRDRYEAKERESVVRRERERRAADIKARQLVMKQIEEDRK